MPKMPDFWSVILKLCCKNSKTCDVVRTVKLKGDNMTEQEPKTFTQQDIDELTNKHNEEMQALKSRLDAEYKRKADGLEKSIKAQIEEETKKANMSELEKANAEIADWKAKYQEKEDLIALSNQKDETRKLMSEMGVDESCLDYVFIPKDIEGTKTRVKAFKEYIDKVKKETFENNLKSTIPGAGKGADTGDVALRKAMGLK